VITPNQTMRRKLTVILASDVAGYSRLVAVDEENTVRRFREAAVEFAELVKRHGGRIFNTAGDAILAEFASAVCHSLRHRYSRF
jgi:class 3 adenylate cyclase